MPYDNAYNRGVAKVYDRWNDRFSTLFAYSPVDGRGGFVEGGSSAGVLFQMGNASKRDAEDNVVNDDLSLPQVYYYGNDSEGMKGGNGFAEGTFRDRGDGHQDGVSGVYKKGEGMSGGGVSGGGVSGGNLFSDIYHGFEDLGSDIGKAVEYVNPFGSGKPEHQKMKARLFGRMLGKMMKKHEMEGKGMSGGSWWDSLKEGVSDVVGLVPHLLLHGLGQEVPDAPVGGAILGNPDPYPVKGNSQRIAGRGRGRPKGSGKKKELIGEKQGDLLAMPASSVVLANGVPPTAQLQGSYGGGKPHSKAEMKVMKAVEKKLKKSGKGMSGCGVSGGKNLSGMTDRTVGGGVCGDGRKARAEIVKRIMKEKGLKMIEASKYVKEHNLYKK